MSLSYNTQIRVKINMSGYLSQNTLDAISGAMLKLHDTFARKIYVYKLGRKNVSSPNSGYNPIYGKTNAGSNGNITYETIIEEHYARIYPVEMDQSYLVKEGYDSSSQNKIILPKGSVRIVVTEEVSVVIKEAKRIRIDGAMYSVKSGAKSNGIPSDLLYDFFLTPIDE